MLTCHEFNHPVQIEFALCNLELLLLIVFQDVFRSTPSILWHFFGWKQDLQLSYRAKLFKDPRFRIDLHNRRRFDVDYPCAHFRMAGDSAPHYIQNNSPIQFLLESSLIRRLRVVLGRDIGISQKILVHLHSECLQQNHWVPYTQTASESRSYLGSKPRINS